MKTDTVNKYVTFSLGETKFGVEVLKTKEIVEYGRITPIPEAPEYIEGVINLRGSVVPVIDLKRKFFRTSTTITEATSIMIVEPIIDNEEVLMGIIVDIVKDVLEIKNENMEDAPKYGTQLKSEYILNVASLDGEFIMILDISKVLSQVEISSEMAAILNKKKIMKKMEEVT